MTAKNAAAVGRRSMTASKKTSKSVVSAKAQAQSAVSTECSKMNVPSAEVKAGSMSREPHPLDIPEFLRRAK